VIVVSFNSGAGLDSIIGEYRAHGIPVVVVENGSEPPAYHIDDIDLYLLGHGNIGYGAALNYGYRQACSQFGEIEWVLLANADAAPSERLLRAITSGELNFAADLLGFHEGGVERWRGAIPSPSVPFMMILRGEKRALARLPESRLYPVGALLLVRARCFDQLRGFDTRFFLYFEEVDLVQRARRLGYRVAFAPESLVYLHDAHAATRKVNNAAAYELGRSGATYVRQERFPGFAVWIVGEFLRLFMLGARARLRRDELGHAAFAASRRGFYQGLRTPRIAEERSRHLLKRPPRLMPSAAGDRLCGTQPAPATTKP